MSETTTEAPAGPSETASWTQGKPACGPALWAGPEMAARPEDWSWRIEDAGAAEIRATLDTATAHGHDAASLPDGPEAFPLPNLADRLAAIGEALAHGPGVALIRGLPVEGLSSDEQALMLRGIGAHLGVCVSQNHRGERVGLVMDLSDEIADPRRYQAGGEFRMHIDPIDIVGLLCARKARRGGESHVVSALAVHNAILAERPELMPALYQGYRLFRPKLDRGDAPALTARPAPLFAPDGAGRFASLCLPDPVHQGVQREGVALSDIEAEALDYLDAVAHRADLVLEMDLKPGDLQLLNNRVVLHGRTAYEDHPEKALRRLMLRLWLMAPDWPPLDPRQRFFDDFDKAGGGIPMRPAAPEAAT